MNRVDISYLIADICDEQEVFKQSYNRYNKQISYWRKIGLWNDDYIYDKKVLDWECGGGAFSAILLELGARYVVGIDSWLNLEHAKNNLSLLPNSKFERTSILKLYEKMDHKFDFIFSNTVTEHLPNLSQQLIACSNLLKADGMYINNHDNYYQPVGSHDHGFLFYDDNNQIVFQGTQCWLDTLKCEASKDYRRTIINKYPWTWTEQTDTLLTPDNCFNCPYYRRSRPWSHLIYQQDFRRIFPQICFTTGYTRYNKSLLKGTSSLNKVTLFQLRQYLIEAGFNIETWNQNLINNQPPNILLTEPYCFHPKELITSTVTSICTKASINCYVDNTEKTRDLPMPDPFTGPDSIDYDYLNRLYGYFQRHPNRAKILYELINLLRGVGNRLIGRSNKRKY